VELLRDSEDDLLPFRPASDIAGRDLLIQQSLEFARRSAPRRGVTMLPFETTLTAEQDRWLEFRHSLRDQAAVIRAALIRL